MATKICKGEFPEKLKGQRLVLLSEHEKLHVDPSNHRSIYLLDTAGKLWIILLKLMVYIERMGNTGLLDNQFGFWNEKKKKIRSVTKWPSWLYYRSERESRVQQCQPQSRVSVPESLDRILKSYFQNRMLLYSADEAEMRYNITEGMHQETQIGTRRTTALEDCQLNSRLL